MLKNIKIAGKLVIGFAMVLIITVIIAIFGIINISSINNDFTLLQDHPTGRYKILSYMSSDLMDIRRIVSIMAFHLGDSHTLTGLLNEAQAINRNISLYLDEYEANLRDDNQIDPDRRNENLAGSATIRRLFDDYYDRVLMGMYEAALDGMVGDPISRNRVMGYLTLGNQLYAELSNSFDELSSAAQITMDNRFNEINATTSSTVIIMVALSIAGVVLGALIAMFISKVISKPVTEVVDVLQNVAHGNLAVNIRIDSKDETGMLAQSARTLVETLQRLIHDMDNMADDHERGEIDTFIDAASFDGEYGTVADKINSMLSSTLATQDTVVGTFMEIADGNFKADMEQLPGKKAKLNAAVNDMRMRIEAVSGEINYLIDAAAVKGNLNVHIDEKKYNGGWRDIMTGLNNLAAAVDRPITEIRDVMARLGQGRFDQKVQGDYPGDFLVIKNGVNGTIDSLNSYISEMSQFLSSIASGDLTRAISREYIGDFGAIKESINNISTTLHKTMAEINAASAQVLSGAKQISTSAMDLANGATEQASSVQELNASVDMISQQTKQNAANADEANALSNKSSENAREGNDAMKQMLDAMLQIKESSNNISRIIKVIQDIAFQTNLLSLNAAVEAARAGEHGKGFSVVAEEVRNLASRSQTAATETTGLIEDSIVRVETGSGIAETTAESLDLIMSNASEVLQIINSISTASRDQEEAVSQVSIGLGQISQVVQSNSAVSEETAAAAEELNSQAELLQQLVSYFKL